MRVNTDFAERYVADWDETAAWDEAAEGIGANNLAPRQGSRTSDIPAASRTPLFTRWAARAIGRAGLPTQVSPAGISFVPTAPIPTIAPLQIRVGWSFFPSRMTAPVPNNHGP